jgi:hypothetical protein
MDTISRGNAVEAAVLQRLVRAEIPVYLPFGGGSPFDLLAVVPPEGRFVRIQVKSGRVREGCVRFNADSTDHGSGQQTYHGRADVIAVHAHEPDAVFVVPVEECPPSDAYLRLTNPKNNQRHGIRFAADLDQWVRGLDQQPAPG